ncbi:hypothetical protein D9M68_744010 [compost metagenome]
MIYEEAMATAEMAQHEIQTLLHDYLVAGIVSRVTTSSLCEARPGNFLAGVRVHLSVGGREARCVSGVVRGKTHHLSLAGIRVTIQSRAYQGNVSPSGNSKM